MAIDHEGVQVARRLNERGITAFVLTYRRLPTYPPSDSLADAERAVRHVRSHADDYGISPDRIGLLGFSAGGHLTTAVGTNFDAGDPDAEDPIDRVSSRPDFLLPIYPVISGELQKSDSYAATDAMVTPETPPTFLFSTSEDTGVVSEHSIRFYQALRRNGVPAEMHIFARGPHGVGLAPGDPGGAGVWLDLAHTWMRDSGFLTAEERYPISGKITVDGEPVHRGWLTLVPTGPDAAIRPIVSLFLNGRQGGAFSIDADHGPTAGPHRVEVRRVALFTKDDPSLEDVQMIAGPGSEDAPMVEIKPGENELVIEFDGP